jgi:8-oxo-dGTP pyrophosphatase MutT (NUDIX family)
VAEGGLKKLQGEAAEGGSPYLRPRDAATLILVDDSRTAPKVLMGRRRRDLAFMPGRYVFPGGRVDPADGRVPHAGGMAAHMEARLLNGMRGRASRTRARALAMSALRETFEEAGLILGTPGDPPSKPVPESWRAFFGEGFLPAPGALTYIARAVTPPGRTRRFDARFFVAGAHHIAKTIPLSDTVEPELEDLVWVSLADARALELPRITHVVLDELEARLQHDPGLEADTPVPFYHQRHGHFVRELL